MAPKGASAELQSWIEAKFVKGQWAVCTCTHESVVAKAPGDVPFAMAVCANTDCNKTYAQLEKEYETEIMPKLIKAEEDETASYKARQKASASGAGSSKAHKSPTADDYKALNIAAALPAAMSKFIHEAYVNEPDHWSDNAAVLGDIATSGLLEEVAYKLNVKYNALDPGTRSVWLNKYRNTSSSGAPKTDIQIIDNVVSELTA